MHVKFTLDEFQDSELIELRQTIELLRKQSIEAGLTVASMTAGELILYEINILSVYLIEMNGALIIFANHRNVTGWKSHCPSTLSRLSLKYKLHFLCV